MNDCRKFDPAEASDDLAAGRRVLALEADGLRRLHDSLGAGFAAALDRLTVTGGGRIIVCGMGKSGHVGRKIAATLASTGTPALYVHPAEASHGDLGMITTHDVILALSNSGETPELNDIVTYSRRFAIPLVAITSRSDASLAQASDLALVLPDVPEACPLGLAPTTSTTMMLALGDALAVALLERRGFTPSDFQLLHPGGRLGRGLLKVSDLMHAGEALPLVAPEVVMAEALLEMSGKSFGCLGVVGAEGSLIGIITDGDLRRHMAPDLLARRADQVMSAHPKTTSPNVLAAEALRLMTTRFITSLFVVDEVGREAGRPIGILHVHDCLRAGIA